MTNTQSLVRALYNANKELALKKSLMHCHVRGLHSVVLSEDSQGRLIRMFITTPTHSLFGVESLALHSHHCDLTLVPIIGTFYNWTISEKAPKTRYKIYEFSSEINKGSGGFKMARYPDKFVGLASVHCAASDGRAVSMAATEMHTVSVPSGHVAAWLVVEGNEDHGYTSQVYSNQNLSKWTPENLYQPFDQITLDEIVELVTTQPVS